MEAIDLFTRILDIKKKNHTSDSECTWAKCVCTEWYELQQELDVILSKLSPEEFNVFVQEANIITQSFFIHK